MSDLRGRCLLGRYAVILGNRIRPFIIVSEVIFSTKSGRRLDRDFVEITEYPRVLEEKSTPLADYIDLMIKLMYDGTDKR